jgi:hypothetical protein
MVVTCVDEMQLPLVTLTLVERPQRTKWSEDADE